MKQQLDGYVNDETKANERLAQLNSMTQQGTYLPPQIMQSLAQKRPYVAQLQQQWQEHSQQCSSLAAELDLNSKRIVELETQLNFLQKV